MQMMNDEEPKKILLFDETHVGYWTGDHESACFNPISPLNEATERQLRHDWYNACTYISLNGLESGKKYRVMLHVEAEEI